MKIKIGEDAVNNIVTESLKQSIRYHVENLGNTSDSIEETWKEIISFLNTLSYYSLSCDYDEFIKEIGYSALEERILELQKENSISKFQYIENDDGSADISFEAAPEIVKGLASLGLRYSILREITGIKSDDEFLRLFSERK